MQDYECFVIAQTVKLLYKSITFDDGGSSDGLTTAHRKAGHHTQEVWLGVEFAAVIDM